MNLELYSLINFFAIMMTLAGLVLPALIIYFYSSYKNHIVLMISTLALATSMIFVGEYIVILLPFILPIMIAGLMGSLLRKYGEDFWLSLGYMIVAELAGMIIGVIIIYFYYGMQDIAGLLAEGFKNAFINIPASDEVSIISFNLMTQLLLYAKDGVMPAMDDINAMSMLDKMDIIVPMIREGMASVLPSSIMGFGIISGVWAWLVSSVMIKRRKDASKTLSGIKEYVECPPFSEWKMPRWFTNVLMVMFLVAIVTSFSEQSKLHYVAAALQTVAFVFLSIQGLAVVNWWLKKKKINTALNVFICVLVVFMSFLLSKILPILAFIGVFDIAFSVRMSKEQKAAIIERMKDIQKQVDRQKNEIDDNKKEEDSKQEDSKQEDSKQEDSKEEDSKDDEDESEEEK